MKRDIPFKKSLNYFSEPQTTFLVAEVVRDLDRFELLFLEPDEFGGEIDRDRVFNCLVEDHAVVVGLLLRVVVPKKEEDAERGFCLKDDLSIFIFFLYASKFSFLTFSWESSSICPV